MKNSVDFCFHTRLYIVYILKLQSPWCERKRETLGGALLKLRIAYFCNYHQPNWVRSSPFQQRNGVLSCLFLCCYIPYELPAFCLFITRTLLSSSAAVAVVCRLFRFYNERWSFADFILVTFLIYSRWVDHGPDTTPSAISCFLTEYDNLPRGNARRKCTGRNCEVVHI